MKLTAFVFAMIAAPVLAQAGDFQITMARSKGGSGNPTTGATHKITQQWVGEIKVENLTFKPSVEVEAKYILFVKRQRLGAKPGTDEIEKVRGTAKVPSLNGREKHLFSTPEVTLHSVVLDGGYYLKEGGATSAADSVSGVWIKLFKDGKVVGEYANPESVKTKYKWE